MYIKLIKNKAKKDGTVTWRLIGLEWRCGVEKYTSILQSTYASMGMPPSMTLEEARARVKDLNESSTLREQERKRVIVANRQASLEAHSVVYLRRDYVAEFESRLAQSHQQGLVLDKKSKLSKMWQAALKILRESATEPEEWYDKPFVFFNLFLQHRHSTDYATRLLGLINEYGYFYCRKFKKPFMPIPKWKRKERQKLKSVSIDRSDADKKSAPLRPEELESQASNLISSQYWWLKYSVWFGLRPLEIDNLNDTSGKYWKIEDNKELGIPLLHICQTKLEDVVEDSWKVIPVFLPEQQELLTRLEAGYKVKRPLVKTLKKYFTEKTGTYAGRKGFVKLMRKMNQEAVSVSRWMGHKTINRTLAQYTEKDDVSFRPINKKAS